MKKIFAVLSVAALIGLGTFSAVKKTEANAGEHITKESIYIFPNSTEQITAYCDNASGLRFYEVPDKTSNPYGSQRFFDAAEITNHKCTNETLQTYELEVLGSTIASTTTRTYDTFKMPDNNGKLVSYVEKGYSNYQHYGVHIYPKTPTLTFE